MSHQKIYYLANKEQILERKKQYYIDNQTQLICDKKRYYTLNRDIILQKNNRKLLCDCGSIITYSNFKRHFKTKKHKDFLLNIQ